MMLHPVTVHFAMALPVVASLFGLIYLFSRSEGASKLSSWATFLAAIAMIFAWYTGSQAGPEIYDYLSAEGQDELREHKELGLYLAASLTAIAFVQIVGSKMRKFALEAFAIILLLAATVVTFVQGKDGGEIVYTHGMPFKAYMIQDTLKDAVESAAETEAADEKVEIYEEAIENINAISRDVDKIYSKTDTEEVE